MTTISGIGNIFKQVVFFGTEKRDAVFTHNLNKSPFGQIGYKEDTREQNVIPAYAGM
jgi:hypothetical protein